MHIPDGGILSLKVAAGAGALSAAAVGLALREAHRRLPRRRVPLMGLSAAVIFAAQMLNFPVAGGTSGHLMGSVLAAALLGPWAAIVVMSAVLIVQCFMFSDGGVVALGANALNMAVVGVIAGYAVYAGVARMLPGARGRIVAVAFAGWCSTVLASVACAGELFLSGINWRVFPAMTGIHMLIGAGEALITAMVVAAIARSRPELVEMAEEASGRGVSWAGVAVGLVVALALAGLGAPFASELPDGLEHVAQAMGFAGRGGGSALAAPMADYQAPGMRSAFLATAVAGAAGTVVVFGLCVVLARVLVPDRPSRAEAADIIG